MNDLATAGAFGRAFDLATAGWPPSLPMELALGVMEPTELRDAYGIPDDQWDALPKNPAFMDALTKCVEQLRQEGMSFQMRAKLIAEGNLEVAQRMILDGAAPATVRKDLIVAMARWAGYEGKAVGVDAAGGVNATSLQIQINLGDK